MIKNFRMTITFILLSSLNLCDALQNLVPFAQFKKREKHPWRSITCSRVTGKKSNTPPYVFFQVF